MRALRGKLKGQGLVEYILILALVILVAIFAGVMYKIWINQLTNNPNVITPNLSTPTWLVELWERTGFAIVTITATILLSILVNRAVSGQDGTKRYPHKLSAKYCLSGISFDLWGLTTILQSNGQIPHDPYFVNSTFLGVSMVGLILMHMILHKNCLDIERARWTRDEKMLYRYLMVFMTIVIPFLFAFLWFYVPRT